jgi:hypothetical protein
MALYRPLFKRFDCGTMQGNRYRTSSNICNYPFQRTHSRFFQFLASGAYPYTCPTRCTIATTQHRRRNLAPSPVGRKRPEWLSAAILRIGTAVEMFFRFSARETHCQAHCPSFKSRRGSAQTSFVPAISSLAAVMAAKPAGRLLALHWPHVPRPSLPRSIVPGTTRHHRCFRWCGSTSMSSRRSTLSATRRPTGTGAR